MSDETVYQEESGQAESRKQKIRHSHPFGHYMAGCLRCVELYPDGPPVKKSHVRRSPPPPVEAEPATAPVMTMEQVLAMVRELRKPDDETLRKRAEEKAAQERRDKEMLELARVEIEQKANLQANCRNSSGLAHAKDNNRSAIQGQVHSDGLYHGICVRCGYQPEPVRPPMGTLVGGLQ